MNYNLKVSILHICRIFLLIKPCIQHKWLCTSTRLSGHWQTKMLATGGNIPPPSLREMEQQQNSFKTSNIWEKLLPKILAFNFTNTRQIVSLLPFYRWIKWVLKVVTQVYTWYITEPRLKPISHEDLWSMNGSRSDDERVIYKVKKMWNFLTASGYATWKCVLNIYSNWIITNIHSCALESIYKVLIGAFHYAHSGCQANKNLYNL